MIKVKETGIWPRLFGRVSAKPVLFPFPISNFPLLGGKLKSVYSVENLMILGQNTLGSTRKKFPNCKNKFASTFKIVNKINSVIGEKGDISLTIKSF